MLNIRYYFKCSSFNPLFFQQHNSVQLKTLYYKNTRLRPANLLLTVSMQIKSAGSRIWPNTPEARSDTADRCCLSTSAGGQVETAPKWPDFAPKTAAAHSHLQNTSQLIKQQTKKNKTHKPCKGSAFLLLAKLSLALVVWKAGVSSTSTK